MKKSDFRLAKRYSRALFDLYDHAVLENVKWAFFSLRDTWQTNTELRDALSNPAYALPQRMEALRELSYIVRKNDERFVNFLSLLLRNNRLYLIPDIAITFAFYVDELHAMLNVTVISAFPLSENEQEEILTRMKSDYSPMVSVSWEVDPGIVGGLIIRAGDLVLDGSVQGSLEKIRKSLLM